MSKLPQLNLRISSEYHDLVRTIAQRLRDPGHAAFARDLTYWINDRPVPGETDVGDLAGRMTFLEDRLTRAESELGARLDALEGAAQDDANWSVPMPEPAPEPVQAAKLKPAKYLEETLAEAAARRADGAPWAVVAEEVLTPAIGRKVSEGAARVAVDRYMGRFSKGGGQL